MITAGLALTQHERLRVNINIWIHRDRPKGASRSGSFEEVPVPGIKIWVWFRGKGLGLGWGHVTSGWGFWKRLLGVPIFPLLPLQGLRVGGGSQNTTDLQAHGTET